MQGGVMRFGALVLPMLVACSQAASDTMPAAASSAGAGAAAGPAQSVTEAAGTFTEVYAMLFPRTTNAHCDMCHGLPPYDLSNGNLTTGTDKASTYAALVGKPSTSSMCKGRMLVVPSQPDDSLLLQKLQPNPPCGLRMPNGGANLSDAQIELVRSWIAAGAPDN